MPEPQYDPAESAGTVEPPPRGGSLIDAITDLMQAAVTYIRQETGDLVREKVALPIQKAGMTVALAIGVAISLVVGAIFVGVGVLLLIAQWIGWPASLFLVGGVLILVSAIIAFVRSRSVQK